ncbi:MAG: PAS domain-containing protein [Cellvibrio sp.]
MVQEVSIRANLDNITDVQTLQGIIARFQRIFSGSGYGLWEWDLTSKSIDWSGGFWERLGYIPEDESYINNANNILSFIHPEDQENSHEAMLNHLRTAEPFNTSFRIRKKSGEYIWTQVRADSIRDADGRALFLSGVSFDITALKQAEEALRESEARQERIIQSSNDGIWEWYANSGGFHFSRRCWELIGYQDNDDEITQGEDKIVVWRKHIHPQDLTRFDQALADHLAGKAPFDIEYRLFGKDKKLHWVRARGRATFNENGQPTRMSGANMDMTQIKLAEQRVIQAKVAAEKANQAKSEFLSSMSHELRTPLNAILGYAQLFEYDLNLTPQQVSNIREIRKAGDHLLQLINDVLDLAKIESGKMTVSLEPVLASRTIKEAFTLVQPQADAKGIILSNKINPAENYYVIADNVRYKQALINLLSNAVKYNNVGGEVEVGLRVIDQKTLRLDVRDNGNGIPANRQAEVFQPFNRLNAESSQVEGSGVGLVITKQLVEMMNGKLDFESSEGIGTHFWIDLPLAHDWNQQQKEIIKSGEYVPTQLTLSTPKNVLYIEDNPTNIRLLQQFFQRHDCLNLDIAEEPFVGIYKARNEQPDLIILDINLPGMDGFEAMSVLQKDPLTKHIPVIGLSANAMPYDIERGIKSGFFEYLTKPVDMNKLIETLNRLFLK